MFNPWNYVLRVCPVICKIKDSFSLFLLLLPYLEVESESSANVPALSRLHQVKTFKLVFCAVIMLKVKLYFHPQTRSRGTLWLLLLLQGELYCQCQFVWYVVNVLHINALVCVSSFSIKYLNASPCPIPLISEEHL